MEPLILDNERHLRSLILKLLDDDDLGSVMTANEYESIPRPRRRGSWFAALRQVSDTSAAFSADTPASELVDLGEARGRGSPGSMA